MSGFRGYLGRCRFRDCPEADFVKDALGDRDLPDPATWRELRAYLISCDADDNAVDAAKWVWMHYRDVCSKRRQRDRERAS